MNELQIISLTTDFGDADGYVGTMKGVILDIISAVRLVDITHQIAPQDVRQTAYVLYTMYRFFPARSIHLVVVDPGVGSDRRAIGVQLSHGTFVGPDNGVFSYVMAEEELRAVVELTNPHLRLPTVSGTFHGRDVFAPAAAHLAAGTQINDLGPAVTDLVRLPPPRLDITRRSMLGEVLHIDHFGNAITSIGRLCWHGDELLVKPAFAQQPQGTIRVVAADSLVRVGDREIQGLRRTYAEVARGDLLALIGSEGHVEIAVREGSGAERLMLRPGEPVELRW